MQNWIYSNHNRLTHRNNYRIFRNQAVSIEQGEREGWESIKKDEIVVDSSISQYSLEKRLTESKNNIQNAKVLCESNRQSAFEAVVV